MRLTEQARLLMTTARLLRSQWWSREEIFAYQASRLLGLLRYAVEYVPYYTQTDTAPSDIRSVDDLRRFPVMTKWVVQERGDQLLSRSFDVSELFRSRSSGMTGEPTITYFDGESWMLTKHALKLRRVLSDTKMPGQRVLLLSERAGSAAPSSWLRRAVEPVVNVRTLSLTAPIEANARSLVQFRPTILYGFPSYLLALAACTREHGWALPRVTLVYTSSEVLTESARRTLADAYGARVIDVYGSTEFKEIAVQCPHGAYHVNFESVYVESVADEKRGHPRLLVSTLVNKAMPLIRFDIGDTGWLVDEACPCGRQSPQIVGLQGRVSEVLSFPDGSSVSPYLLTTAIEQYGSVRHFRIVHEQPLALRIEILAVPPLSAADLMALGESLRGLLPAAAALHFVALTERGPHGKRRAVSREF